MLRRFVHNVSANTLTLFITNASGLVVFYVLSKLLDKTTFGNFNWALAVILTALGVLTGGIDQLVVKKVAVNENPSSIFSLYFLHVLLTGTLFYCLLVFFSFLFPSFYNSYYLLLYLATGKVLVY